MRKIRLTSGSFALVDDEDYRLLAQRGWYENDQGYAYTKYYQDGKQKQLRMHRLIMNTPLGMDTDHINRNKLDNRKSNLRIVDRTTNNFNSGLHAHNTSGIKGVAWHKAAQKWTARIQFKGKSIHLGLFSSIEKAQEARNIAEEKFSCPV